MTKMKLLAVLFAGACVSTSLHAQGLQDVRDTLDHVEREMKAGVSYVTATAPAGIEDQAKVLVLDQLSDPSSAQFGPTVYATTNAGGWRFCGTVNARNKFGGYAGIGSVNWRLDGVLAGAERSARTAIRAEVSIPDAYVRMTILMQRNAEQTLPASHTIKITFAILPGGPIVGIKQIGSIQMRDENAANGDALVGATAQITDSVYLVGLARGDFVGRNLDLLKNRGWLDVPLALTNGRIAKFSLEKDDIGSRVIAEAITAWDQERVEAASR